jgi:short-subunit dehydrogenase
MQAPHWIIGASSGIGQAVAEAALKRGEPIILTARNAEALQQVAAPYGDLATVLPCDITDPKAIDAALAQLPDVLSTVQVYVGTYTPAPVREGTLENLNTTLATNLWAPIYLVQQLLPKLHKQATQGHGIKLALCGSVAGFIGLPNGQPYSATKAALQNFTESLRAEELAHAKRNHCALIDVRLISPGFVRTRLTAKNDFKMPFLIEPEAAATAIWRGLNKRRFHIVFPRPMALTMGLLKHLPYGLYFKLFGR